MQIRVGYELVYECPQPTPMILMLNIHFTRVSDLVIADHIITTPPTPLTPYRDGFGNWCSRIVAPPGDIRISTDALVNDNGLPDGVDPLATQHAVEDLPAETLVFLLGSRYCETDRLTENRLGTFRADAPWVAARQGNLRFRPWTYHLRLPACPGDQDRARSLQ